MDEAHLANLLFDLDEAIRKAERDLGKLKRDRETLEQELAEQVGVGGVVFIHDGSTMVIVGRGTRAVDKEAVERLKDVLPPALQPRKVVTVKYPTVSEVEGSEMADQLIRLKSEDRPYSVRFRDGSDVDFGG